jgi:threonine dehydratase
MACRIPDDEPLEIMRENVDHVVTVSDDEIRRAMKIISLTPTTLSKALAHRWQRP